MDVETLRRAPEVGEWTLAWEGFDPQEERLREALSTLGNGVFATRGSAPEALFDPQGPHYAGTYVAGGYDRRESLVAGRTVENEDLVNWPSWLPLTFRPAGSREWFRLDRVELLEYRQELDVRAGLLTRRMRFRDPAGRTTRLCERRLVSMAEPDVAALEWTLTPLDWSGPVEVRSGIDGAVENALVERYRDLASRHTEVLEAGPAGDEAVLLTARALQSRLVVAQAARTRLLWGEQRAETSRELLREDGRRVFHLLRGEARQAQPLRVEKVVSLHTSRDPAISEPRLEVVKRVARLPGFTALASRHRRAWARLWSRADICLEGQPRACGTLRAHVFHLLQTASMHTIDRDVGIPARGLHGEAYRGHIFWDELYMFPFLDLRIPELTRSLLMYRYRRLPEARQAAREAGYRGAMFPWQSGSDGREESQLVHLNPRSGRWVPDETHRQRHVNAAIAWSTWQYVQATGDLEFLSFYGAELLLEIARFWASLAEWDDARGRFSIRGVVGPDEFHTHTPRARGEEDDEPELGLVDNAYTNLMAAWSIGVALAALERLAGDRARELREELQLFPGELQRMVEVSRRLRVPLRPDGIIEQFAGWDELEELDWEGLRARHGDIHRLDRLLEAEGDDVNRYKATKQADVLMLFYLFSCEELEQLFQHLGYPFDPQMIPRNIHYYLERTSHGSTLSRIVHAWVLARSDREQAWSLFQEALLSDLADSQGGTTAEGIHLGAMAGTVDLAQRCFTGLEMRDGVLWLNPRLPADLERIRLRIHYHGHWLRLDVTQATLVVTFESGWSGPAQVGFDDQVYPMSEGDQRSFDIPPPPPARA